MPKIVQQTGSGTASNIETLSRSENAGCTAGAFATVTGALVVVLSGTVSNGCVFVILTAAGSGRMLMRAVSFFGPACVPEPG